MVKTLLCEGCGQPIKAGRHKPGEYEHAQGCPKKKNKGERRESGNWRPSRWTDAKLRRFMRHVCKHAWDESDAILGAGRGSNAIFPFLCDMKERESLAMLHRRGIRTIGDVERDETRNVQR